MHTGKERQGGIKSVLIFLICRFTFITDYIIFKRTLGIFSGSLKSVKVHFYETKLVTSHKSKTDLHITLRRKEKKKPFFITAVQ